MPNKNKREQTAISITESFQKIVLGFLPGGHVIDEFLNFRSNLRRERVLEFSDKLKEFLLDYGPENIDESNYIQEEFHDVFESVINKILTTKSERKLECYKNIVLNQIIQTSTDSILTDKIIQTVDELNEIQILIIITVLKEQHQYLTIYKLHEKLLKGGVKITISEEEHSEKNTISSGIFIYLLRDLVTKGLLNEFETDHPLRPPSSELKQVYKMYIAEKQSMLNSNIVYTVTEYSRLLCRYIDYDL